MISSRSLENLFISNGSGLQSSRNSGFFSTLKNSQHFKTSNHFRQQSSVYQFKQFVRFCHNPLYSAQNALTKQIPRQTSFMYESQVSGKQSLLLQRSKSQIIQPVYLQPFKNKYGIDLDQSYQLGASKASQITFSKPSQFIINNPKQNPYLQGRNNNLIPNFQISADDYGYNSGYFQSLNPKIKNSLIILPSPIKQSYFLQPFNDCRNSAIINPLPQPITQLRKDIQSPMIERNSFIQAKFSDTQIIKNTSHNGFTIRPTIRRCLSNVSIFSQKSKSKLSQTKIKFNYISPKKSENKMGRKISFKNQDVKNPLTNLCKMKQQKSKISQNMRPKINSEAVNEYFPEFKIKKNKMKICLSPEGKQTKVIQGVMNAEKTESCDNSHRRITLIASLDALSQLSQIKNMQTEEKTKNQASSSKVKPQLVSEQLNNKSKTNIQSNLKAKSIGSNKITGQRITLDRQKVQLLSPRKEEVSSIKDSQVSKEFSKDSQLSQLSVNSIKNGEDLEFLKKHGNDSSHTTDYEDEIVKKIKEDLGLHFSYHKKK